MSYTPDVGKLFEDAESFGDISPEVFEILRSKDVSHKIKARTGLSVIPIEAHDVILVAVLIDDSQSIGHHDNAQAIIKGHNACIDALMESTDWQNILFRTQFMDSGFVLNDWVLLKDAQEMTVGNYSHEGMTPLYDSSVVFLGSVIAEVEKAKALGKNARSGSLIVTDGKDEFSKECSAGDVSVLTQWMTRNNTDEEVEDHAVAFMGIKRDDINHKEIAKSMGIGLDDEYTWIILPNSEPRAIRRAFETFSRKVSRGTKDKLTNRWLTKLDSDDK